MSVGPMREYLRARKARMLDEVARFKAANAGEVWLAPGVGSAVRSAAGAVSFAESRLGKVDWLLEHGAVGRADQVLDQAAEAFRKARRLLRRAGEREDGFRLGEASKVHES